MTRSLESENSPSHLEEGGSNFPAGQRDRDKAVGPPRRRPAGQRRAVSRGEVVELACTGYVSSVARQPQPIASEKFGNSSREFSEFLEIPRNIYRRGSPKKGQRLRTESAPSMAEII